MGMQDGYDLIWIGEPKLEAAKKLQRQPEGGEAPVLRKAPIRKMLAGKISIHTYVPC